MANSLNWLKIKFLRWPAAGNHLESLTAQYTPGENTEGVGTHLWAVDEAKGDVIGCSMVVGLDDCLKRRLQGHEVTPLGRGALSGLQDVAL